MAVLLCVVQVVPHDKDVVDRESDEFHRHLAASPRRFVQQAGGAQPQRTLPLQVRAPTRWMVV